MTPSDGTVHTDLAGKTILVLGASSPHGAATVRVLAAEGANLALGGRSREKLEALALEAEATGGRAIVVGTHLAKRHHPAHLVEAAVETFGGLDVLLYMASAGAPSLGSLDVDSWERSLDVNLRGFVYCLAAAVPAMRVDGGGCVAVAGQEEEGDPLLRASRAAVRAILGELSRELSSDGIRTAEVRLDAGPPDPVESSKKIVSALKDDLLRRDGGPRSSCLFGPEGGP